MSSKEKQENVEQKTQWDADTVELLAWLLRGKSLIDFVKPTIKTHEDFITLLKRNGYVYKNEDHRRELNTITNEAIAFCERLFANLAERGCLSKDLPRDVHEDLLEMSTKEIFHVAAGTYPEKMHPSVVKQACIIVKTILIISYLNRSPNFIFQEHAFRELNKWKQENFSSTADGSGWTLAKLKDNTPEIYLKEVTTDKKPKESLIRKLMSKDDVTTSNITDFVRVKIVTKTPLDLMRLLYVLAKENRIPWNLTLSKEPKQELIDFKTLKNLMENAETAEKFVAELLIDPTIINGLKYQKKKSKSGKGNEFSSEEFKCVDWPLEFLVPIEAKDANGNWITSQINYPLEIQLADLETAHKNWRKDSDVWDEVKHDKYRDKQKDKIGARTSITTKEIKVVVGEEAIKQDIVILEETADRLGIKKEIEKIAAGLRAKIEEVAKAR